jgi:hypothetical protein
MKEENKDLVKDIVCSSLELLKYNRQAGIILL